jgi:hypothetical protein
MSVRSVAVRQAARIRSERAVAFAVREAAIEELTVEFFEASGRAEEVVESARLRCEQITAAAETEAQRAQERAATALTGLQGAGVPRAEIAQITGLSARQVRDVLTARTASAQAAEVDDAGAEAAREGRTRTPDPREPDSTQHPAGADDANASDTSGDERGISARDDPAASDGPRSSPKPAPSGTSSP